MISRRKIVCGVLAGAMVLFPLEAAGQETPSLPDEQKDQQSESTAPAEQKVLLKEGTEVHLKLAQTLTSKTATAGEPVEFVLAEDLRVGEDIVARKGTRALGTVAEGKKSEKQKTHAKQLSMRFDHMRVGDSVVQLTGQQAGAGKRDTGKVVAFTILFGLSGYFATSTKKFVIPEGTPVTAYVEQDIEMPILATESDPEQPE
jgi:hypothetical protein